MLLCYVPAHRTDKLAEIVCSNSLKSDEPGTASYLLKEELRRGGSLVMQAAAATRVPAGAALAVDRAQFAEYVTDKIESHSQIELVRKELTQIPRDVITIVATGPLTSDSLTADIIELTADDQLYFYDAIAPIVAADSVDHSIAFRAARYGKGGDDYLNCPLNEVEYAQFYQALVEANSVPLQRFEETRWFEACLPIEELARRGVDTLRYGPMKPVGLINPYTGEQPYAAVQLRQENLMADAYSLVGFQNHLRYGEQARVLRMVPGLERAEFLQFGQIHRNTYINAPQILLPTMAARRDPRIFFAGQLAGTEGYVENVASGLVAGINAVRTFRDVHPLVLPAETAIGALCCYVSTPQKHFAPMNINFGLLPPMNMPRRTAKTEKHRLLCERALELCQSRSTSMA